MKIIKYKIIKLLTPSLRKQTFLNMINKTKLLTVHIDMITEY
jgi:hypothetical protein